MTNADNRITYHSIEEVPNAHILEISFPKGHDKEEVTSILKEAGFGKRHSQFFNRSGVYIYFLTHNEKEKVYVGQATQLESRALNKARLKKEQVSRMLLFSTKRQHQFDESEIQHLEYYVLQRLKNSSMPVKNAQSVAPSITSEKRSGNVEDWFNSMDGYLKGKFDGLFDNASPVGFDVEIELRERNNKTQYCVGKARFNSITKRVLILADQTIASHRRWQVPLTYQKVKSAMIASGLLSLEKAKYGKYTHDGYVFKNDMVLMNISEATTIILNAPQAANAWFIVGTNTTLQDSKYW
jgi:hypothetical protein